MSEEQAPSGNRRILFIVLGVLGGIALISCVVCGAGGMFCAHEIQPSARQPALIEPSLYVGNWAGEGPTTLTVDTNSVRWEQYTSASGHISYSGTFAGISGQDIRVGVVVTEVTLEVSDPPHQDTTTGAWVMTVEGVQLTRQ
jgi:hypothetical protein